MIWVLDYRHYLHYMLRGSTAIEQLLMDGPVPGGAYGLVVECIEQVEYVQRACALIRRAQGTVRLVALSAAQPAAPPAPSSAFAGTMRPGDDEPLLKASGNSAWYTALLSHLFLSARPKQHLVLWGAPGVGKSLALQRARTMAVGKAVPHMFVSAATDGDDETDLLLEARQFFATAGAHGDALFVIDDVEAFASARRAAQLLTMMSDAQTRCVLVCNDSYAEQVRALHRRPERYRFLEATRVTDDALAAHLRLKFPQLAPPVGAQPARDVCEELAREARGDVRAAQLAAELEVGARRSTARLQGKLQRSKESSKRRAPLMAALGALQRRSVLAVDDQQHGSLTGDMLRCVRAKVPAAAPWWQRSCAVVQTCDVLLQPRAVDAAETMQSNYPRLCGESELELMARMSDDVSSAFAYRQAIVDGMMADKFSRYRPDDSVDDNFKDRLVFDMAVVLPCVRASRGDVGVGASRTLKLEFPEEANRRQAMQLSAACRRLDVRHEVLMRSTLSLIDSSEGVVHAERREELEQRARQSASVLLTTATAYYAQKPRADASEVDAAPRTDAKEDDGDGKLKAATASMSIDRLERTLFVFAHLVAGADMRVAEQRKAAIARCAAYGYDAEMYARAALLYRYCANEAEGREHFASAGALVLDQNHRATAVLRTEIGARANATVTAVPVTGPTSGAAAGARQSAAVGGGKSVAAGKSAAKRKAGESSAAQKHSASAPTFMDKFLSTVAKSKGGKI